MCLRSTYVTEKAAGIKIARVGSSSSLKRSNTMPMYVIHLRSYERAVGGLAKHSQIRDQISLSFSLILCLILSLILSLSHSLFLYLAVERILEQVKAFLGKIPKHRAEPKRGFSARAGIPAYHRRRHGEASASATARSRLTCLITNNNNNNNSEMNFQCMS